MTDGPTHRCPTAMRPTTAGAPAKVARPTIRDVARLADVSVGTASKALNNNGSLRQETRDRVIKVAGEIGFRPNDLAQSLHRGQSLTVGLISNRQLRPLHHADHGGAGGVPHRQPHGDLHV